MHSMFVSYFIPILTIFSEKHIKVVEGWNSLEQYIGLEVRLAFNYYCSLHQV